MALLSIGTPPQVCPSIAFQLNKRIRDELTNAKGALLSFFLQSVHFQAKDKKGRAEEEREVKGRDKEVRMKLRSEINTMFRCID